MAENNEEKLNEESVEVAPETSQSEETTKEEVKPDVEVVTNEKTYSSPSESLSEEQTIEKMLENQEYFKGFYKKSRNLNLIILSVFAVLFIALIILNKFNQNMIFVMIGLVIVYLIFLFVYQKKVKAKIDSEANNVINKYFVLLDSLILDDSSFSEVKFNSAYRLDEDLVPSLHIVKDIKRVGGRDEILGKFNGHDFTAGDALVRTSEKDEKGNFKDYIVFLGKLFVVNMSTVTGGRSVIYLKGKGANGPTDVEDLVKVENVLSDKYVVFASCDIEKVLTPEAKEALESFETNETLIDMFIEIDSERVAVGLSYSDGLMRVPLFDEFDTKVISQYNSDVKKMIKFLNSLKCVEKEAVIEDGADIKAE